MALLVVEPQAFTDAGLMAARWAGALDDVAGSFGRRLAGSEGMAGSDAAARDFGAAYDDAAAAVLDGVAGTARAGAALAENTLICGAVYEATEGANAGLEAVAIPRPSVRLPAVCHPAPPRATGQSASEGPGLDQWILDACGVVWPGAHPPALRLAADQWHRVSSELGALAGAHPRDAARRLSGCRSADSTLVMGALAILGSDATALSDSAAEVAAVCGEFADEVEQVQAEIRREAALAALEAAGWTVVGAAAAPLTAGGSIALSGMLAGGRFAAIALRLTSIIARVAGAAQRVAARLASVVQRCAALGARLAVPVRQGTAKALGWLGTGVGPGGVALGARAASATKAAGPRLAPAAEFLRDSVAAGLPAALAGKLAGATTKVVVTRAGAAAVAKGAVLGWRPLKSGQAVKTVKETWDDGQATMDVLVPGQSHADRVRRDRQATAQRAVKRLGQASRVAGGTGNRRTPDLPAAQATGEAAAPSRRPVGASGGRGARPAGTKSEGAARRPVAGHDLD